MQIKIHQKAQTRSRIRIKKLRIHKSADPDGIQRPVPGT